VAITLEEGLIGFYEKPFGNLKSVVVLKAIGSKNFSITITGVKVIGLLHKYYFLLEFSEFHFVQPEFNSLILFFIGIR